MSVKFEVLHPGVGDNISVVLPSNCIRGSFVSVNTVAADDQITAKLAATGDDHIIGFTARDVTTTGQPSTDDILFGGRLETPEKNGFQVSIEPPPRLFAIEDTATFLDAGYAAPAVGDLVNFIGGKIAKPAAASGKYAFFKLIAISADADGTASNRLVFERLNENIKV